MANVNNFNYVLNHKKTLSTTVPMHFTQSNFLTLCPYIA